MNIKALLHERAQKIIAHYKSIGKEELGRQIANEYTGNRDQLGGLGDLVKKGTDALNIPQCGGCKQRQEWLNKKFPFKHGKTPPG